MLSRTLRRLWTPKYFRGQGAAVPRQVGPRRRRTVNPGHDTSAHQPHSAETVPAQPPVKLSPAAANASSTRAPDAKLGESLLAAVNVTAASSPSPDVFSLSNQPIVQRANVLLQQLTGWMLPTDAHVHAEAARNYAEFSARRDVLGPLRQYLPTETTATMTGTDARSSSSLGAGPRFRVVSPLAEAPAPSPPSSTQTASRDGTSAPPPTTVFNLGELTLFLQLYEQVNAEDGQLLVQLMRAIHQQLDACAQERVAPAAARTKNSNHTSTTASNTMLNRSNENQHQMRDGVDAVNASHPEVNAAPPRMPLPLPALLYTMSSLGIVEEAALDLIVSAAPLGSTNAPARRGLLYRQLPLYSTKELLLLMVALHRFGLQQQPSMQAVTRALRASLYNKANAAGAFHRMLKTVKKQLYSRVSVASQRLPKSIGNAEGFEGLAEEVKGVNNTDTASTLYENTELQHLVLRLQCPLYLLLEALTTSTLTVYRRTDVVTFLSDLIAMTAFTELAMLRRETASTTEENRNTGSRSDMEDFAIVVSHQLLRAAKLAEEMEQPQLLLSDVFAWSCTVSGKSVFTDGGEDRDVPSDRMAYYDHVTADLIKVGRTD